MLTAREAEIPARYYLGLAVKCQGSCATDNFRKAVDLCAGWAKRDPQNPKAFFYMGYALRHSGRRPDAVLALNKAIALSPNFDLALNGKAVALTDLGHFEEAVATLKRLLDIKKAPNPENNLGVVSYDSGKFEDAVGYYKQAINLDPTYAGAYGNLGYALLHLGRNGEAVTAFNSARRLDLSNYSLLKGLAMALTRAGNPIVARNECNLASLLDPMAWQPHWIRGVVGLESHDAKVAQIEFNAALTIQPTSTVWVEIARASRLAGDQIGARSALETALKLDRYNARAHHLLGVVLSAVGDSEEAKEHFATAEKLAPSAKVDFDDDKRPL
jgi:tetratricopeptide (TPR) repeat protein